MRQTTTRLRKSLRAALSVATLLLPLAAAAADQQQSLKSLSLEELGKLQVTTVSKEPEAVWRTAAAIFIISHDDIVRAGATTIPEALRLAPGVEVARIESNKWAIGIRGFGSRLSRSVLVLIDGRTVYTSLFAGTYWETQDVLMEDVDRIEVIRGPGGTIWGPNAINGVINIITKPARDTRGIYAQVTAGNVERGAASLRFGGGNGDTFNYRIYGKGFNRGPEFHPDGKNFDDWRSGQAGFRADWTGGDHGDFSFQGDIYQQQFGERVTATTYAAPYSRIVDGDARLSGGNLMGRWKMPIGPRRDMQVQAYYDRTNRHEPNFADLRDTFDVDFLFRTSAGDRQRLAFGTGARISRGHQLEVVSGLTFDPSLTTDAMFSVYLQDEFEIVPKRLSVTAGAKLLHTNFTGVELEPSVRLLWTPSEHHTVWAAFTRAVRTPADVERNFFLSGFLGLAPDGTTPFFARFNANRDFRSESLRGYELGYRHLFGAKVFLDLAGYFNQYDDLFSIEVTGAPFVETTPPPTHLLLPARFGNSLRGTTSGVEIAPEWRPASYWRLRGSYSFLSMHIKKQPGSADIGSAPGVEGASPQHQVAIESAWDFPHSVSLDLQYRYVSALPAQMVAAYHTAGARFGWNTGPWTFSVVGQNLLQPHHFEFGADPGFVGIKREVYGKVEWRR